MSKFKIAIANVVTVAIKFALKNEGVEKRFAFTITADRLTQEEINKRLEDKDQKVSDFMRDLIKGWDGQRLVLTEPNDEPAEFSEEALDAMLNVAGVGNVMFQAYLAACGARAKN